MSVQETIAKPTSEIPDDLLLRPISVAEYHEMIRAGILPSGEPIELIEGWLVEKMPKSPSHALATDLISEYLRSILPLGWFVRTQDPITLNDSEPEPDVCVVKGTPRQYGHQHPHATAIALIVEVADSSLGRDRGSKKRIYARAGIPVYWIVNLTDQWIEVYNNPTWIDEEADYQIHQVYRAEEQVTTLIDQDVFGIVAVHDLLPN